MFPRHRLATLLFACCLSLPAVAAPPDDVQLQRLFELTNVEQEYTGMVAQFEAMQRDIAMSALPADATPAHRLQIQRMVEANQADMRRIMAWEKMRPIYFQVYRDSYEAQDIEAMNAFYATPAGRRMVERQPLLMRNLMQAVVKVIEPEMDALRARIEQQVPPPEEPAKP